MKARIDQVTNGRGTIEEFIVSTAKLKFLVYVQDGEWKTKTLGKAIDGCLRYAKRAS